MEANKIRNVPNASEEKIIGFLSADPYFKEFLPKDFGPGTSLKGLGVFDSLSIVGMINFLEKEFSIAVEAPDITEKNFESVAALAAFADKRRA